MRSLVCCKQTEHRMILQHIASLGTLSCSSSARSVLTWLTAKISTQTRRSGRELCCAAATRSPNSLAQQWLTKLSTAPTSEGPISLANSVKRQRRCEVIGFMMKSTTCHVGTRQTSYLSAKCVSQLTVTARSVMWLHWHRRHTYSVHFR
eukprot:SAG31_NODE_7682_length_1618_cov_1.514812_2_plen_149_part_00